MVVLTLVASVAIGAANGAPAEHDGPLTLRDCIRTALERNRSLLTSRDAVATAQFRQDAVAARYKMRITPDVFVSSTSGANVTDEDVQTYGIDVRRRIGWTGATVGLTESVTVLGGDSATATTVELQQPLMQGLGPIPTLEPLTDARRAAQRAERLAEMVAESVVFDTIAAYFAVMRAYRIVDINQRALERDQRLLDACRGRLEVGRATKLDVLRAEMQVLQDKNAIVAAEQALGDAYDGIKLLLAVDVTSTIELRHGLPDPPAVASEQECIDRAFAYRPDYVEAVDAVTDAERKLKVARNGLWPVLNLDVQYSRFDAESGFGAGLIDEDRWTIGLVGTQTLDRADELAAYRVAERNVDMVRRARDALHDSISREIRSGLREIERARAQMAIQTANVEQAVKRLELAKLRYERGLEDNFAVVDAQDELVMAEVSVLNARIDHLLAVARLFRDMGIIDEPETYLQFCTPGSATP